MPLHVLERSLDVVDLPPPLFTGIRMTASRPEKAVAFALAFLLLGPHLVFPFADFGVSLRSGSLPPLEPTVAASESLSIVFLAVVLCVPVVAEHFM